VIGVNSQIASDAAGGGGSQPGSTGVGFAISSNTVARAIKAIQSGMGVSFASATRSQGESETGYGSESGVGAGAGSSGAGGLGSEGEGQELIAP
jgi:S1-C subfamily serine protease